MAKIIFMVAFVIAVIFVMPFFIQLLWNTSLVSAVTWAKEIGYWEAFGVWVLFNILNGNTIKYTKND